MGRPVLLDLFCGAGGAAVGYYRAGFAVVGVDKAEQPNYPYKFIQADAIEYLAIHGREFDMIHASPPCQLYSQMTQCRPGLAQDYPDMIPVTRAVLKLVGVPWVIENVPRSTVRPDLTLCGHMFGLKLYWHRLFELSTGPLFGVQPYHPPHITPGGRAGHWKPGEIISVSGSCSPIALAREAMGIDWMNRTELAESIPPAYTEYIGEHLIDALRVAA